MAINDERLVRGIGHVRIGDVVIPARQWAALQQHYEPHPDLPDDATRPLIQAGMEREVIRRAQHDGLRMIAILATYLQPDEDPVSTLRDLINGAGWDFGADIFFVERGEE